MLITAVAPVILSERLRLDCSGADEREGRGGGTGGQSAAAVSDVARARLEAGTAGWLRWYP